MNKGTKRNWTRNASVVVAATLGLSIASYPYRGEFQAAMEPVIGYALAGQAARQAAGTEVAEAHMALDQGPLSALTSADSVRRMMAASAPAPLLQNPRAREQAADRPQRWLVSFGQASSPAQVEGDVRSFVARAGGRVLRAYDNVGMLAVQLTAAQFLDLKRMPGVSAYADELVEVTSTTALSTAKTSVTTMTQFGQSNSTIGVAVVDSGVASHPDINLVSSVSTVPVTRAEEYADNVSTSSANYSSGITTWS